MAEKLRRLSEEHRLFLGASSWKYPGWCGILYDEERYLWGTHFSRKRFDEQCLEEYSRVFPSVCVDATYYALPKIKFLTKLGDQVPDGFRLSFKVPDEITIKNFPNLPAFRDRAGTKNEYFLSAGLFNMGFLRHLEGIREKVGALIFEFSHFHANDFAHGREFVEVLERFFEEVPDDWQYAVEIRNGNLLHPDYFAMLRQHGVAHVYNQWTRMPSVSEQLGLHPAEDNPFVVARYMLTPGRSFEWASEKFAPYNRLQEIDPDARKSMGALIESVKRTWRSQPSYLYVGNDLEGNALHTLADVLENR